MSNRPGIIATDQAGRAATAAAFDDADVAAAYARRPPYAPAAYARLLSLAPRRRRALDLGCGPGKIAAELAAHFEKVVALDRAEAMISAGRAAHAAANIDWMALSAETCDCAEPFDLICAGTSIHWLDHPVMFPKLARWTSLLGILVGDAPRPPPCGDDAWTSFVARWVDRVGGRYDPPAAAVQGARHEAWMDIAGRESFAFTFRQSVSDFVRSQHSRATWTLAVLGSQAAEFDAELTRLMAPHAVDGMLALAMTTELTWGAPRTAPHAAQGRLGRRRRDGA
jgi:SAM-dependent methyltransferase